MYTHKDVTNQKKKRHLPAEKKIVFLGLMLAVLAALAFNSLNISSQALIPNTGAVDSRAMDAWAARYQGLADRHALQAANFELSNNAWANRLQGQADAFALQSAERPRANAAYTARLQGMADWFAREK